MLNTARSSGNWRQDSLACQEYFNTLDRSGALYERFRALLPKYARPGGPEPALGFSIDFRYGPIGYVYTDPGLFGKALRWDMPHRLRLLHMGRFLAGISFEPDGDGLLVWQIQALAGLADALAGIRWERALVAILCEAARGRYARIGIVPARHIESWPRDEPDMPVEKREFRRMLNVRYNVTPKLMGFRFDEARQLWTYDLRTG